MTMTIPDDNHHDSDKSLPLTEGHRATAPWGVLLKNQFTFQKQTANHLLLT